MHHCVSDNAAVVIAEIFIGYVVVCDFEIDLVADAKMDYFVLLHVVGGGGID